MHGTLLGFLLAKQWRIYFHPFHCNAPVCASLSQKSLCITYDSNGEVLSLSQLFRSAATDRIQQLQEVAGGLMFTKCLLGATAACCPMQTIKEPSHKQTRSLHLSGQMRNICTTAKLMSVSQYNEYVFSDSYKNICMHLLSLFTLCLKYIVWQFQIKDYYSGIRSLHQY